MQQLLSWGEPVVLIDSPESSGMTSVITNPQMSLSFSKCSIELPAGDGPNTLCRAFAARIPFAAKPEFPIVGFVVDFSVGGERTGGTRASIAFEFAGTAQSLEFPRRFASQSIAQEHRVFSVPAIGVAGGGVIGVHGEECPDLPIAILVTAQRDSVNDHLLIEIDNIDLTAIVVTGFVNENAAGNVGC